MTKVEKEALLEKRRNAYRSRKKELNGNTAETNKQLPTRPWSRNQYNKLVERNKWKAEYCNVMVLNQLVERNKRQTE
ncbi:hypothetical protein C5167_005921 [Papaver somniferum]|uniref:Uncharacterized protein n=1 Tax=Papaver somniferum TaxID=3469 RepID=A0A4Y7JBY1_PAPSO|nr:hypothetical protein C5167_005921 [Papaver somniferum]